MEAVDDYMANMLAYPGRTFGQLYHRFFRVNELAQGKLQLTEERRIDLAEVTEPVLVVAGTSDVLAPVPAVLAVENLLPNAAEVESHTAPGGHLGVLTGRSAMTTTWNHLDDFLARHDATEEKHERAADEVAA
jgi:polyhydroxyalkanoate synthase